MGVVTIYGCLSFDACKLEIIRIAKLINKTTDPIALSLRVESLKALTDLLAEYTVKYQVTHNM